MIRPESISRVLDKDVYDASDHKLAVCAWVRWPDGQCGRRWPKRTASVGATVGDGIVPEWAAMGDLLNGDPPTTQSLSHQGNPLRRCPRTPASRRTASRKGSACGTTAVMAADWSFRC